MKSEKDDSEKLEQIYDEIPLSKYLDLTSKKGPIW